MTASDSRLVRPLLLPAVLGGVAMIATVGLIDTDGFIWAQALAGVFALIVAVIAIQQQRWWWAIPAAAIAVVWNPVLPLPLPPGFWWPAHYVAAFVFLLIGLLARVPQQEYEARTPRN